MPGLKLFTSNRMEILVKRLADILATPLSSPTAREIIIVQSKGMERWIAMELAQHHGICANVWFPYPIHFVHYLFRETFPHIPEPSPYEPAQLVWDIMQILPLLLHSPPFRELNEYLGEQDSDVKLFQISEKIANLFDQYILFRPDMILMWDRGHDKHWQAILWREIVKKRGTIHRAAICEQFIKGVEENKIEFKHSCERIHLFGISALPRFYLQILRCLSTGIDVNLFLMNPCREFWEDIVSDLEMNRLIQEGKQRKIAPQDLHLETGNRLLASMGTVGKEFLYLLNEAGFEEYPEFKDPGEASLLAAIQSDILHLRERKNHYPALTYEYYNSISIHSCHSPLREVEVLHDYLLSLFDRYENLKPHDILVMVPDIELYVPYIQAVFRRTSDDPHGIPFVIADRGIADESVVTDTFLKILNLAGNRLETSVIMDILEQEVVRTKFSLHENDLSIIHQWIRHTNICWGKDAEHKLKLNLPATPWNTWRSGIERLLLGYALPQNEEKALFMGILPYDIEGDSILILGRFLSFIESLFSILHSLEIKKTVKEWKCHLHGILTTFFSEKENYLNEIGTLRALIDDIFSPTDTSTFSEPIDVSVVAYILKKHLKEKEYRSSFLTGGITFCTILPMRSIPFRVICMIGMNDDAFPRNVRPVSFDLMAQNWRVGDRSRRLDDKYLFLEAFLSAREHLFISYVGQDIRDNSTRPPSTLVSELMDYIEDGFGKEVLEKITTRHPLHGFDPVYFENTGKYYSYSEENLKAARIYSSSEILTPHPFISSGLSEPDEKWKTLDLETLCDFFVNPTRFLLKKRLGLDLYTESALLNEYEPFEMDALVKYVTKQEMAEMALTGKHPREYQTYVQATGRLPHGTPGTFLFESLCHDVSKFVEKVLPYTEGGFLEPREIDLYVSGFHLTGRFYHITPNGLVFYRGAKIKGRDRLVAWIRHVVFNYIHCSESENKNTFLICEDRVCSYLPVPQAHTLLLVLLQLYWEGLKKPLHFFPESSLQYAEKIMKKAKKEDALNAAFNKWDSYFFKEGDEPYHKLCYRFTNPLDEEFCNLSLTVYEPMLKCERGSL